LERYRGNYTYLGRRDQSAVVEEMRRCHVLVLPSVFEGFGLVIPEAMATGMPVIASTHSIGPEIIRDGEDGFVLEPDDVDGLAARLNWLASHRRNACEMGRNAAVQAQSLSWERHQERVAELIGEIVEERTTGPRYRAKRASCQIP
jgi:glycosyltransferase involved in cell wall biosynthesis